MSGGAHSATGANVASGTRAAVLPATGLLASFAAGLRRATPPPEVCAVLRRSLLDSIGCGIFGATLPWTQTALAYVADRCGPAEATVWTTGLRAPVEHAAFALGTMIHAFDFDDYHPAKVHPGAAVIPAVCALGERVGADGQTAMRALAAGYEVMVRTSLGLTPAVARMRGWHLTGICGALGAAAAAGVLLDLGDEAMTRALGLAATQAAGLFAFTADGSHSKRLHPGWAAQRGIIAADLARRGFPGPTMALEASDGGWLAAHSDAPDPTRMLEGLGERWHCLETSLKPYAACGSLHSAIDAVLELRAAHGIDPRQVARVTLGTSPVVITQCGFAYEPHSVLQAQLSAQYVLAAALWDGNALAAQFSPGRIADRDLLALASRVESVVDPEVARRYPDAFAGAVTITMADGRRLHRFVEHPRGSAARPLSDAEVQAKFRGLAGPLLGEGRAQGIEVLVANLGKDAPGAPDLRALAGALT